MKMNGMCYVYAADLNWIVIYANSYGIVILRCVKKHLIHFFLHSCFIFGLPYWSSSYNTSMCVPFYSLLRQLHLTRP